MTITLNGLILPVTDDTVRRAFIDMVGRLDHDMYALADFGSASLSAND